MSGVSLDSLCELPGVSGVSGDGSVQVTGVQSDSRAVGAGDLFAAIVGERADGTRFAPSAVGQGAGAVLAARDLSLEVPTLLTDDVRACLGPVSHRVYGDPSDGWPCVGITGTNGKTTVAYLLESVLTHCLGQPAILGTIAARGPAGEQAAALTTPEADAIARFARRQRDAGASGMVMEVSSHALDQGRADGMHFRVAAFTNLTQDHLDYHGDFESYGRAKSRLFEALSPEHSVIMVDAEFGEQLAGRAAGRVWRCSTRADAEAELRVVKWQSGRAGIRAEVLTPAGRAELTSPLIGAHNLENLLVVLGVALALELPLADTLQALKDAPGAPGRMERVQDPRDVAVLVDYAHTPDALKRAVASLRPLTDGRLWVVCGCGGDRDRTKRAPMARAATEGADLALLTSDNPRTEDPAAILQDMRPGAAGDELSLDGLADAASGFAVVVDRAEAIRLAIHGARAGDTVLIAGKGHEDYQILGERRIHFDDREQARDAIASAGGQG